MLSVAARLLKATVHASKKGKGDPTRKKEQKICGEFGQSEWPGVTGSDVTLCWVFPGPLSGRKGRGKRKGQRAEELDKNREGWW